MRNFLIMTIFATALAGAFDAAVYNGRYSGEVWQDVKSQGRDFHDQIQRWLDRALSSR